MTGVVRLLGRQIAQVYQQACTAYLDQLLKSIVFLISLLYRQLGVVRLLGRQVARVDQQACTAYRDQLLEASPGCDNARPPVGCASGRGLSCARQPQVLGAEADRGQPLRRRVPCRPMIITIIQLFVVLRSTGCADARHHVGCASSELCHVHTSITHHFGCTCG
jgi:hypothetical protein